MSGVLDVQTLLSAEMPATKKVDLKTLSYAEVLQLRTGVLALRQASAGAHESLRQALILELGGASQEALFAELQRCCFQARTAMRVITDVIGG